jgi:predicted chitinase
MKLQDLSKRALVLPLDALYTESELVKQIQIRLKALSLLQGEADGSYGPITKNAIASFCTFQQLPLELSPSFAKKLIETKTLPLPALVTPQLVAEILNCPIDDPQTYLPGILLALKEKDLDNRLTLVATLATIGVETGGFKPIDEQGDDEYFTENYEWRSDLGNDQAGDGARYHGRGYLQITGRANYREYGQKLGVDLEGNPDLALDPIIAARILAYYFWDLKIDQAAAQENWEEVRTAVNGGLNGWDVFIDYVDRALAAL